MMHIRRVFIFVALLVIVSMIGVSAYTVVNFQRTSYINVTEDDVGLVGLRDDDGTVTDGVKFTNNGDFFILNAKIDDDRGLNPNSTFIFGKNDTISDTRSRHTFRLINNDDIDHSVTLGYTDTTTGLPSSQYFVNYEVYYDTDNDSTLEFVGDMNRNNDVSVTVRPGTTVYVVLWINTPDTRDEGGPQSEITGEFSINSTDARRV